jgi:hypothetical protein
MIEGLFERLQQAEAQAGPRDGEAEALIRDRMARQPTAPYLLAQVVLVQEQGLRNLQARVEELERERAERPQGGGGFLGGLFGGGRTQPAAGTGWSTSRFPAQGASMPPGPSGGGFLAGAMQTAMGVAGGMLLANAVSGVFAGEAQAAEPPAAAPEEPEASAAEEDGGFFGGGEDEEI